MSKIDPTEWDPPEYLPRGDQQFLKNRASTMHKIQGAAYLTMGQVLLQVKEKFKNDSKFDGWWIRWVEEATPIDVTTSYRLLSMAKSARSDPNFVKITESHSENAAFAISKLPPKARKELCAFVIESGTKVTGDAVTELGSHPLIQLEQIEQEVETAQINLAQSQLLLSTTIGSYEKSQARRKAKRHQTRLELAVEKLGEARSKVNSLEKERSTQDLLVAQINAQLKNKELQLEELSQDPVAKRRRAVAKTVVEATNGLDLLLQSLDKLEVDRDDIGEEALSTIERKMALLKKKLKQVKVGTS